MKPGPMTNRERLVMRTERYAKLVHLGAPKVILAGAWRLLLDAYSDCEQFGYDVDDTYRQREAALDAEIRDEAEKHKAHLDGPPVTGCLECEYGHSDGTPEVMP